MSVSVAAASVAEGPSAARLAQVSGVFREIGDLKRIRVAHTDGSLAQRGFVRSWSALLAGAGAGRVAARECAAALSGARLGGIDAEVALEGGVTAPEVVAVLERAVAEVAEGLHPVTVAWATTAVPDLVDMAVDTRAGGVRGRPGVVSAPFEELPGFVGALCRQPRAGATAPGRARLIVEPPENHAEHCWAVAVYGALLAEDLGADPGEAFLLGLAHHLHNAVLPDAGFAGETLLGGHLDPLVRRLTERELATLPARLHTRVRALLELRADADTSTGRAFHAADVLDRVLQVHHHARAASFNADHALVDLELVHAGPVTQFHRWVLASAGL